MRYMLLIVGDESQYANMSEEEQAASSGAWADYTKALTDAGAFVSGDGLQSSTTATTLRVEEVLHNRFLDNLDWFFADLPDVRRLWRDGTLVTNGVPTSDDE